MVGFIPGVSTPAATTPNVTHTGRRQPNERPVEVVTLTGTVAIDATGTTLLGEIDGYDGELVEIRFTPTQSDFDFRIYRNDDGSSLVGSQINPSDTSATVVTPDSPNAKVTGLLPDVGVEIGSASGTADATMEIEVDIDVDRRTSGSP